MPLTGQQTVDSVFNNVTPSLFTADNYLDPFTLATGLKARTEVGQPSVDILYTKCFEGYKNTISGFLDFWSMNKSFKSDVVQFIQSTTPEYTLDAAGAVTRAGNVFTIDFTVAPNYTAGEDAFFYQPFTNVIIVDTAGKEEHGTIQSIDKAAGTFTATCKDAAAWSGLTTDLALMVGGGDYPKASCAPAATLEQRKRKTYVQRLAEVKRTKKDSGKDRYEYCIDGVNAWSDDTGIEVRKLMHTAMDWNMLLDTESEDGTGSHAAGSYGSLGLIQNIKKNGLDFTGGISTVAEMREITTYYSDVLGFEDMTFNIFADNDQFRKLEIIAGLLPQELNVTVNVNVENKADNMMRLGFKGFVIDGFQFNFTKWNPTGGNSEFKGKFANILPKALIIPEGTVETTVNGVTEHVPYVFKAYKTFGNIGNGKYGGMIRTYLDGAFYDRGTCEYAVVSEAANIGIIAPCPEALCMVTA